MKIGALVSLACLIPRRSSFRNMPRVRLRRPRRGKLDSKDHLWFGEYWAGRLGVFDPTKGNIKEYALGPEVEPFGAAYTACYSASPDDNNHIVWTMDTNSGRIYKVDMDSGQSTEYLCRGSTN